ncbi:sensor histidine kinase [Macromonas nakdongensis]|uniref:sensor histidine kinase n=1 Tax=Macromonas nakdongensis TaxID=1843082 RepID=UPI000C340B0E|nr:ATP-binding protein [Macromonas nakdongensis]
MPNVAPAFPAFQLLLVLSLTLIVGLPALIWLFLRGNRDRGAQWWFAAVAANAAALVLLGVLQRFNVTAAVLFVLAVGLAIESMRWELGGRPVDWRWATGGFAAYALLQYGLDAVGLRMSWGYLLNLLLLNVGDALLIWWLWRVMRQHQSRGLLMVALGIAMILLPNIYRWFQALAAGGGPEVFAGSVATNVSVVLLTIVSALQSVGYGGFVMEKLHRRQLAQAQDQARAEEKQRLAEAHALDLEAVLRQRDEMIVLNSRFSSVSKLSLYNSAIVHEISQPLQALTSILDSLSLQAEQSDGPEADPQRLRIRHAQGMVRKLSDTLMALRTLMDGQPATLEPLRLDEVLVDILPILHTQARRQQVALTHQAHGLDGTWVQANAALLQRVIFNLATNALEALELPTANGAPPVGGRQLVLDTALRQAQGRRYQVLSVQDNGPGLPDHVVLQANVPLRTTKARGVGVGLSFSQMIVESWRGELRAFNRPTDQGPGAVVEVWLPLAATPTAADA